MWTRDACIKFGINESLSYNTCLAQQMYESKSIVLTKWQKQNHKSTKIGNNSGSRISTNANDAIQTRIERSKKKENCVCEAKSTRHRLTRTTFNLWTGAHKLATSHAYEIECCFFLALLRFARFIGVSFQSWYKFCVERVCVVYCCWFLASLYTHSMLSILFGPVFLLLAQSHSLCPWRCWRSHH